MMPWNLTARRHGFLRTVKNIFTALPWLAATTSPLALAAFMRGANAGRILGDTARSGSSAFALGLPERTVGEALGVRGPCAVTLDAARMSLFYDDLVPLLELVRRLPARRVFEIGTFAGGTTWHLAANLPGEGTVYTLDLPPQTPRAERYADAALATVRPTQEDLGRLYRGTAEEKKIAQVLCDSGRFDPADLAGSIDLVFIDGSHTCESVRADTALARRLVREGGAIVWHDYFVFEPDYGIRRCLDGLYRQGIPLFRFPGGIGAFGIYRAGEWKGAP